MARTPPDNEYTRGGDAKNVKLPPSVRWMNGAKAFATSVPAVIALLAALGWTNKDAIKQWIPDLAEADGQTEVETGSKPTAFQLQVKKFTEETRIELDSIKSNTTAIRSQLAKKDQQNYTELKRLVDAIDARVAVIEQEVQP